MPVGLPALQVAGHRIGLLSELRGVEEGAEEIMWLTPIPSLTPVSPRLMRLDSPVAWLDDRGRTLVVPAGFVTDGASLPWIVTAIWDRWEPRTLRASILHDYGYSYHKQGTKAQVDKRFYEGLRADKWDHALTYYRAVKYCGWYAWNLQRNVRQG